MRRRDACCGETRTDEYHRNVPLIINDIIFLTTLKILATAYWYSWLGAHMSVQVVMSDVSGHKLTFKGKKILNRIKTCLAFMYKNY